MENIINIEFGKDYIENTNLNAWTKYEVDDEENVYNMGLFLNKHTFNFPENKIIDIIIHELIHCSFYQLHANNFLSDDEVIFLNEFIDDYFPTIYFECDIK